MDVYNHESNGCLCVMEKLRPPAWQALHWSLSPLGRKHASSSQHAFDKDAGC